MLGSQRTLPNVRGGGRERIKVRQIKNGKYKKMFGFRESKGKLGD